MTILQGFWSYVHADDQADAGRISRLARDVVTEYEMLTGEKINLFLDKDAIEWGEKWREKIDDRLASVGFFVSVLTPRYFMSAECRRELQYFARKAVDLGVENLIMPLVYVDPPELHNQETSDDLVKLIRQFQWVDWQELRFSEVNSGPYRKAVSNLANRIVRANRQAEESSRLVVVVAPTETTGETSLIEGADKNLRDKIDEAPVNMEDEELGTIDILADTEEKMNLVPNTLNELTKEMVQFGDIMRQATADMQTPNSAKSSFAYRQMISRRTALQLKEPTERIWSLSNELSSHLHTVDRGYRIIIERANKEISDNIDSKKSFCTFFSAVRNMVASAQEAIGPMETMINSTEPLDKMSRDLRPVTRRLRQGLTIMIELRGMYQEWIDLIDATGILCEDEDSTNQSES